MAWWTSTLGALQHVFVTTTKKEVTAARYLEISVTPQKKLTKRLTQQNPPTPSVLRVHAHAMSSIFLWMKMRCVFAAPGQERRLRALLDPAGSPG